MSEMNYKKIFEKFLIEHPHQLDALEKIATDAHQAMEFDVYLSTKEIIENNIWDVKEKIRLLNFFHHDTCGEKLILKDEYGHDCKVPAYLYSIQYGFYDGFEALMLVYENSKKISDDYNSKSDFYRKVAQTIAIEGRDGEKELYLKKMLTNLDKSLIVEPHYEGNFIGNICNSSIFSSILQCKSLELVRFYLPYVSQINSYLTEAVATGNIKIVKLFLERGADVNFVEQDLILGKLTPLKMAIANNDYAMFRFLVDHGADMNLKVDCSDFLSKIKNYKSNIFSSYGGLLRCNFSDEKVISQLKYISNSSPLEYAIKLSNNGVKEISYQKFDVCFKDKLEKYQDHFVVDVSDVNERVKNREKIVDLLFHQVEDRESIDYTDLIVFSFMTRNLNHLKRDFQVVLDFHYSIDFELLFQRYFEFQLQEDSEILYSFLDFQKQYDASGEIILIFFQHYLEKFVYRNCNFYETGFSRTLLNSISLKKRTNLCLVPYCKNLSTLKWLLSLGFDINQVDCQGRNILYYLLKSSFFGEEEQELFDYLLENLNLLLRDNHNKNMLYYGLQNFSTENDIWYAQEKWKFEMSKLEKALIKLISKMPKQEILSSNADINQIFLKRTEYCSSYGEKIYFEYIYQYHKELFENLLEKGFVFEDKMLEHIFACLYPIKKDKRERLYDEIDKKATLDFLYKKLDYDIEIQKLDIKSEFKKVMSYLKEKEFILNFDEFQRLLKDFNIQILSLNSFYQHHVQKKYCPEKYLEYARERYNTIYDGLDYYLFFLIIWGIQRYGNDKIECILDIIPNYDINSSVFEEDVNFNYWRYVGQVSNIIGWDDDGYPMYGNEHFEAKNVREDDDENIEFTGNLMQYAILSDDLSMVKSLQKYGASLQYFIDEKDHTWDYVNSYTMLRYIESFVGEKNKSDFTLAEKNYYLKLEKLDFSHNIENRKMVLKK